ncbi:hypothetical protein VNO80_08246 [Phaseolus coccineus]|uniref:BHLH domain-containing protein n=1 Tax=Phaseolus coccineus TaxID=3886 RepID=A0AAN9NKR0_PHACN
MSEAGSYSIDIAKMKNALLSSVSSRLHCYGNDEVQFEILEGCMQMNDLTNFHCNGFNLESRIFNNDSQMGEGVNSTQPSQSQTQSQSLIYGYNHHPGSFYAIPSIKDIYHHPLLVDKDPSSQYERVCGNKRPFEYTDNMSFWKRMKSNPNSRITITEPKWHQAQQDSEIIPQQETDTASVLREASLYIKLLQAQIRSLFQMLSFSYINRIKDLHTEVSHQECGDKLQVDLRSRGLCLVPVSVTEKVKMVDQIHQSSASTIIYSSKF